MITDLQYIVVWFALLSGLWLGMFPLLWFFTKRLPDGGFGVGLPFAATLSAWIVWMLSSLGLMPFSLLSSLFSLVILLSGSTFFAANHRQDLKSWLREHRHIVALEIALFFISLLGWSIVRGFQPDIQGLEKFMDAGFVNSILRSPWMPPHDPWLIPLSINYYYFGHFVAAFLTMLSGIDPAVTYNLMLATVFASLIVGGMSVVFNFLGGGRRGAIAGLLTALLLNFGGNLHTFWHIATRQTKPYWYPDATRFIPYTIHEFPAYSHVVADLHGHLMNLPVMLLFLVLLIAFLKGRALKDPRVRLFERIAFFSIVGFLLGIASISNTWDVPIYGLIFTIVLGVSLWKEHHGRWMVVAKEMGLSLAIVAAVFLLTSFPFHLHFKNFAKGIAPVEARSPVWQLGVLWGGFLVIAVVAIATLSPRLLPFSMIGVSLLLILIPEVIYVKDIYIKEYHRANTMFKLTYQSFVMMCLVFGMTLGSLLKRKEYGVWSKTRAITTIAILAVFAAHMMYPFFSIKSYYGLTQYRGLYGLQWFASSYADDYQLLLWLQEHIQGSPAILEAVGESYTDYARFSSFSGLPTVLGWRVHEWLWRGSFDEPEKRTAEVLSMYQTPLSAKAGGLFEKYHIRYVIVGTLEKKSYRVSEQELLTLGHVAFRSGSSYIVELE